jgi:hypothetical protein
MGSHRSVKSRILKTDWLTKGSATETHKEKGRERCRRKDSKGTRNARDGQPETGHRGTTWSAREGNEGREAAVS